MLIKTLELGSYFAAPLLISFIDFVTLIRTKFKTKIKIGPDTGQHVDFTILVPIFGNTSYLKNIDFLAKYRNHVVLCTTDKESAEFNRQLEEIAEEYGFKIFRSEFIKKQKKQKPNPWRLFRNTLVNTYNSKSVEARDQIIKDSFTVVRTEYCIFIDGDTVAEESLYKLLKIMKNSDFDVASVRVLASKTETLMEKLQAIEYEMAMDARTIYPWLTSGAAMVAKTSVMQDIMNHHSLFFSGGDIEIGKLARLLKYKVGHIAFDFLTDVPSTFRAWFKQRMAWFGGGFRHAIVNIHRYTWRHPLFYFYTTGLVYLLVPLRWYEVIRYPLSLLFIVALYWVLILIFHWNTWQWFYLLFPLYALTQVMILVPLGIYAYLKMSYHGNNLGLIRLRHSQILLKQKAFDLNFFVIRYKIMDRKKLKFT